MKTFKSFERDLYELNEQSFEDIAYRIFRYQATENKVYKRYLELLRIDPTAVSTLDEIPFLPIDFYKTQNVISGVWEADLVFKSSGTTGTVESKNCIYDLAFYHRHAAKIFEQCFGPLSDYHILALLPSYMERTDSSLISMIQYFIQESESGQSGYYLNNLSDLRTKVGELKADHRKILIWGVTFALLDLAENFPFNAEDCLVIETGGMKGRGKELTRADLYSTLKEKLNLEVIYSEYGMTELFSMAYSKNDGQFRCPATMKVAIRDINDPFRRLQNGRVGGINIIDLANYTTCSFIETQDLGKLSQEGYFEVLGRIDNSDIRGCNLLVG